jgi:hypothetical protein
VRATPLTVDPDWVRECEVLAAADRPLGFFEIGDMLNRSRRPYGQTWPDAERIFGVAAGTLSTYAGIARRVAPTERVSGVGVGTYEVLAPLAPALQRRWLAELKAGRITGAALQRRLRDERKARR